MDATEENCMSTRRRHAVRQRQYTSIARSLSVALVAAVALVDVIALAGFALWFLQHEVFQPPATSLTEGEVVEGIIGPKAAVSDADKPFIDYGLRVTRPGRYLIALETDQPQLFEPFFVVRLHDNIVDNAFASGSRATATIDEGFIPGSYTIRVTSVDRGRLPSPAHYKLSVRRQDLTSASHKSSTAA